jgi:uncharacterized membrane protein
MAPVTATTLAYEPILPWITGMAVAQWSTRTTAQTQSSPTPEEAPA